RQGREVADERVPFDRRVRRRGKDDQRDVRLRDHVLPDRVALGSLDEDAARVVGNQVVLRDHLVAALEQQADGGEAAVVDERVRPEDEPPRIHDRGAGVAALEDVVLEQVVVREHVVEAVAQIVRAVAADGAVRRRLDVDAVADVGDVVADQREAVGVPDVDAGALLARRLLRDAADLATLDAAAGRVLEVDPEQRAARAAVADRAAGRRDHHRGRVAAEIAQFAAVDVEPYDRHGGRGDGHDRAGPAPHQQRPSYADQVHRAVDDEGTDIATPRDFGTGARG